MVYLNDCYVCVRMSNTVKDSDRLDIVTPQCDDTCKCQHVITKVCTKCKTLKYGIYFVHNPLNIDGLANWCTQCIDSTRPWT